jgi:hypothetical protein
MEMIKALLAICTICAATSADARPDRVSILMGSHHFDAKMDFNEVNPGIFVTWEKARLSYSVGAYENSFGKFSVAALAAFDLVEWQSGELSVFAGIANYPEDGRYFAVHWDDVVPIGGVQVRQGNVFAQIMPSDGVVTSAILSMGLTFSLDE